METPETSKHKNDESQEVRTYPYRYYTLGMMIGSIVYGIVMFAIFASSGVLGGRRSDVAYITFLGLVPFGIGVISTFALPSEKRTLWRTIGLAAVTTIIFMIVAGFMFSGIWLCVLMIAPFVIIIGIIGALLIWGVGKVLRWSQRDMEKRKREYVFAGFLILLPLLASPFEASNTPPNWMRDVTDSIVIKGTPETVWNNIIRMDTISSDEQRPSFYHTMGIPRPIRATLDKEAVGGIRQGEFEFGLMFYETITVWEPNEAVQFTVDVHTNPQSSPTLMNIGGKYFDILEAGYQIEPVDAEHVRLTLNSEYRLSTNFNFYGAFWSDWIMHDFQSYVLQTVKTRVENGS
jgi:hypothetical protein